MSKKERKERIEALETRLFLTSLEGIDECELAFALSALAESIPVINVSQPVHQVVALIAAVC